MKAAQSSSASHIVPQTARPGGIRATLHHSPLITHQFIGCILAVLIAVVLAPSSMAQTPPRTHLVKPGDTLYRIAVNNGTSVAELQRLNDLENTTIHVGQELLLEAADGQLFIEAYDDEAADDTTSLDAGGDQQQEEASEPAVTEPASDRPPVESGRSVDSTPERPATDAAMPVDGQIEVVLNPVLSPDAFRVYAVQSGDDFSSVGARLGIAPGILEALNLDIRTPLAAGTEIRLPIEMSMLLYAVRDGDSVEQIAARFGSSVEAVMELNAMQSTTLRIGQRLRIPIATGDEALGEVSVDVEWEDPAAEGSPGGGSAPLRNEEVNVAATVTGNAHVYPDRYQGRVMANGRPYDAKRFTVSHPTLELGSVVLLTNEQTGRKTFAEVTDRLPSGADYLLDVSTAVADVLGLADGGGEVTVQVTSN